jgi:hypothetical protein
MRFLADERLYAETDYCLASLRTQTQQDTRVESRRPWRAHLYWHGAIGRKQALTIASFLAAHDPGATELWLWLDAGDTYDDHDRSPWLAPLVPWLRVQPFDAKRAAAGTPLDGRPDLYEPLPAVRRSNYVRSVVLFRHGGLYADMDLLFLRDCSPLMQAPARPEFCYRWSARQPYANSAVLALEPGSDTARALLERCRQRHSCRPRDVLRFDTEPALDLLVLPCAYFDPLWPVRDGHDSTSRVPFRAFDDFFRPFGWRVPRPAALPTIETFFPGAFAYHWHNGWNLREHEHSFFGALERDVYDRLSQRRGSALTTPAR